MKNILFVGLLVSAGALPLTAYANAVGVGDSWIGDAHTGSSNFVSDSTAKNADPAPAADPKSKPDGAPAATADDAGYGMKGLETKLLFSTPRAIYSPWVDGDKLYLGGWKTAEDLAYITHDKEDGTTSEDLPGPDRIYVSKIDGDTYSEPEAVPFSGPRAVPGQPGALRGYHVNDMSIIHPNNSDGQERPNWAYMYFTCLPNEYFRGEDSVLHNQTCWAISTDGGESWSAPQHMKIIGQNNRRDDTGAWAPSAILSPDGKEIWIYYSSNESNSRVLRTRVKMDGNSPLGMAPDEMNVNLANVDVTYANGVFYMSGNKLGDDFFQKISLFVSKDGVSWKPFNNGDGVLIDAGAVKVLTPEPPHYVGDTLLTPHLHYLGMNSGLPKFDLYFAINPLGPDKKPVEGFNTYMNRWRFRLKTVIDPEVEAPAPHTQAEKDAAAHAFADAYAALITEEAKGKKPPELNPWIMTCKEKQETAHQILEDNTMYQWSCDFQ